MLLGLIADPELRDVRLAMQGSEDARNRLFEFIYARVLRYHRKLARGQVALADEWTQETMIRVLRSFDRLRDPERFVPWAFRIATNVWRDHHRTKLLPEPAEEAVRNDPFPENEDLAQRLVEQLEQLPETYRSVLTLRYLEGLSYDAMAEVLGTPVPTL